MQFHSHPHDKGFIAGKLQQAPREFHYHIKKTYSHKFISEGRKSANLQLLKIENILSDSSFSLASDDQVIRERADYYSKIVSNLIGKLGIFAAREYVERKGIKVPECETETGEIARYACPQWWRRQLRKKHGRSVEKAALQLDIVNSKKDIYSSQAALNRRKGQRTRNRAILESCLAVNELGDKFTLQELSDLSVSNPVIRRGELMMRIAGFEAIAKDAGQVGEFWTFTCPSRMHSCSNKYDGTTPREAQKYLSNQWAKLRAALHRRGITLSGFRVAEPQHDGTPHWHLLLFMESVHVEESRQLARHYALEIDGDEAGAHKYRFDYKAINWKKGSAAGYIAKYIAKNIDGFGIEKDLFDNDPKESAARVDAWASVWGIRQFQQIGGAPVTLWREMRRSKIEQIEGVCVCGPVLDVEIHKAADRGDWASFTTIYSMLDIEIVREHVDEPNKYCEPKGNQIIGFSINDFLIETKLHKWSIENKNENSEIEYKFDKNKTEYRADNNGGTVDSSEREKNSDRGSFCLFDGGVNQAVKEELKTSRADCFDLPWSSVNNCTQSTENNFNKNPDRGKYERH